ncbi:MAG: hypothetical protein M3Z36_01835, partial [Acidobacteriota bacterium]|nr:hypothetical protein [Acidobacteriota bacterium]
MKIGADRNKLVLLGVFGAIALYVLYSNVFSGSPDDSRRNRPPQAPVTSAAPDLTMPQAASRASTGRRPAGGRSGLGTFHPRVREPRLEDRPNLATIDPTLHLDVLAKVQRVPPQGGVRNLFQYSTAAATPVTPVKLPKEAKIAINKPPVTAPVAPPGPPKPPPPPPINLKYYGYSSVRGGDGKKRAFFLDGDDIIVAGENEMIKRRYKV